MSQPKRRQTSRSKKIARLAVPPRALRRYVYWVVSAGLPLLLVGGWFLIQGMAGGDVPGMLDDGTDRGARSTKRSSAAIVIRSADLIEAPGLDRRRYVAPLEDAYRRLDPARDGWQSEAFNDAAGLQLDRLAKLLAHPDHFNDNQLRELASDKFACPSLRPASLQEVFRDGSLSIKRRSSVAGTTRDPKDTTFHGWRGLGQAAHKFAASLDGGIDRVKLKQFKVEPQQDYVSTTAYFQAFGATRGGTLQVNATWGIRWSTPAGRLPQLEGIEIDAYEEIVYQGGRAVMFADCTESVLGDTDCYRRQFLYPTDHWRARIPRDLGLDVVANHGVAIGDVNGDQLDDLYVCQQGGLPNRLLIQNADGTLRDASAGSGTDWLDYCASALLVDLDNDGDRDLVVAQEWRILLMSNDGRGKFQLEFGIGSKAQSFSLAAADYDQDGDLDIYVCGYNPTVSTLRRGAMGEPMPYHDANNGGRNMLLRNDGFWSFADVTYQVGLDENNTRFSFAASWEDYDNDGDLDLYVANDYGRNNLYRNDGGRFADVAAQLSVEDISAGMSASWGDYNRDGWMDLYVSNMFSAAGNRIAYQRQFKSTADASVRAEFQRHARGNTLFENTGPGGFRDVSEQAGVTMGRWAWGSNFVDLNGDGWEDLAVANGFITAADTGDL